MVRDYFLDGIVPQKRRGLDLVTDASFAEAEGSLIESGYMPSSSMTGKELGSFRYKRFALIGHSFFLIAWIFDLNKNDIAKRIVQGLKSLESGQIFEANTLVSAHPELYPNYEGPLRNLIDLKWNEINPYHLNDLRNIEERLRNRQFGAKLFTP